MSSCRKGELGRGRVPCDLCYVATYAKSPQHAVGIDPPDRRNLGTGDGLFVGHDRQAFQRSTRQTRRLTLEHETLDVRRHVGVALETVAASHPCDLEAAVVLAVRAAQVLADLVHGRRRQLEQLCQHRRLDGRFGDHEDSLDRPTLFQIASSVFEASIFNAGGFNVVQVDLLVSRRGVGVVSHCPQPSYSSVEPPMEPPIASTGSRGELSASSWSSKPSQLTWSSPSLLACSRSTAPRL